MNIYEIEMNTYAVKTYMGNLVDTHIIRANSEHIAFNAVLNEFRDDYGNVNPTIIFGAAVLIDQSKGESNEG